MGAGRTVPAGRRRIDEGAIGIISRSEFVQRQNLVLADQPRPHSCRSDPAFQVRLRFEAFAVMEALIDRN